METIQSLFIALGIFVIGLASPGPNLIIVLQRTLNSGLKAGIMTGIGIALGDFIYAFIGLFGLTILISLSGWIFGVIKFLGGMYLIYLGLKTLKNSQEHFRFGKVKKISLFVCFRNGFITDLSNPKTIIFFTSIFAATINEQTSKSFLIALAFSIFITSIVCRIGLAYLFSRSFFQNTYVKFRSKFEAVFGILLILFGLKLTSLSVFISKS